ncbi:MAG: hypothetical protein JW825_01185, partial [Candidatus Methanofastidiosa archaeon]|nr:hypothetical protein [Candidatus Methanofastidiosa archaeon]
VRDLEEYDGISARPWEDMHHCLSKSDIVINCTTVGMEGCKGHLPIGPNDLDEGKVVMDIVYDPLWTGLLETARNAGSLVINGLEMLVHQGAISFERWTGLKPPISVMKDAIEKHLMVNFHEGSNIPDRVHG